MRRPGDGSSLPAAKVQGFEGLGLEGSVPKPKLNPNPFGGCTMSGMPHGPGGCIVGLGDSYDPQSPNPNPEP